MEISKQNQLKEKRSDKVNSIAEQQINCVGQCKQTEFSKKKQDQLRPISRNEEDGLGFLELIVFAGLKKQAMT